MPQGDGGAGEEPRAASVIVLGGHHPVADAVAAGLSERFPGVRHVSPSEQTYYRSLLGADVIVDVSLDMCAEAVPAPESLPMVHRIIEAGAPNVIVVGSGMVLGTSPAPHADDANRLPAAEGMIGRLIERENAYERAVSAGRSVVHLRCAALVGQDLDTSLSRHFAAPRLVGRRGPQGPAEMLWQFLHVDDLIAALALLIRGMTGSRPESSEDSASAAAPQVPAVAHLNLASPDPVAAHDAAAILGLGLVYLPEHLIYGTATRLYRTGLSPAHPSEVEYLLSPWVLEPKTLESLGWVPEWSNTDMLKALAEQCAGRRALGGRPVGGREAAVVGAGAASATLAVLGAAAVIRHTRRMRGH